MRTVFPAAATPCVAPLAAACLFACASAWAAEPARPADPHTHTELDRVIVHARRGIRTVDDIEQARRKLDERAGGTALVDGESYRDRRAGTLADALGFAPGVFVQPRFGADEARIAIRGSGLQRTFHGRGLVEVHEEEKRADAGLVPGGVRARERPRVCGVRCHRRRRRARWWSARRGRSRRWRRVGSPVVGSGAQPSGA